MRNKARWTCLIFKLRLLVAIALPPLAGCNITSDEAPPDGTGSSSTLASRGIQHRATEELSSLSAPAGAHLSYFGGPVISNVEVVQVLYGGTSSDYFSSVFDTATPSMASFYGAVVNNPYLDWLTEYDTNGTFPNGLVGTQQTIGRGSFRGQFHITPSAANDGPIIGDSEIQAELEAQIDSGALPSPTTDAQGIVKTLYMIHFPIGKKILGPGATGTSCEEFCAYHGTLIHSNNHLYYGVLPDISPGSGCEIGCGASGQFQNQTSIASHELVEAVTDPEVGLATTIGPPLAWIDGANGEEIGDLCTQLQGAIQGADGATYIVQMQFSNLANDCVIDACQGETLKPAINLAVFSFVPGEIFVVDGNTLIKIAGTGSSTVPNMFETGRQGSSLVCNVGQNQFLLGDQEFSAAITSINFVSGMTIVGLANGKIVKVNGTGGLGHNMFAVTETSDDCGFAAVPGFNHYVGSHKFSSTVVDITPVGSQMFVSLASGDMLKVNGAGGSGCNMFALQKTSCGYASLPGFSYLAGSEVFDSPVTKVRAVGTETFVGLQNGALLKVRGTGGAACNMLALQKTSCGYASLPGFDYLVGSQDFGGQDLAVADVTQVGSQTLVSLKSGDMLKVNGTGGAGCNMFAVQKSSCGFTSLPNFSYLAGSESFEAPVTEVRNIGAQTFVGLANGKLLKLSGTGRAGCNMFAIEPSSCGYSNLSGFNFLVGSQELSANLTAEVTDVTQVNTPAGPQTFMSLSSGEMWRVDGSGGAGCNNVIDRTARFQD